MNKWTKFIVIAIFVLAGIFYIYITIETARVTQNIERIRQETDKVIDEILQTLKEDKPNE